MIRLTLAAGLILAACEPCDTYPAQSPGGPCLFGVCGDGLTCIEAGGGSFCASPPRPDGTCGPTMPPGDPCVLPCEADGDCTDGMYCAEAAGLCVWPAICVDER